MNIGGFDYPRRPGFGIRVGEVRDAWATHGQRVAPGPLLGLGDGRRTPLGARVPPGAHPGASDSGGGSAGGGGRGARWWPRTRGSRQSGGRSDRRLRSSWPASAPTPRSARGRWRRNTSSATTAGAGRGSTSPHSTGCATPWRAAVDVVLITSPDRLARCYAGQGWLLEELARAGCAVVFLERPPRDDPQDALLVQIRGAVAEYARTPRRPPGGSCPCPGAPRPTATGPTPRPGGSRRDAASTPSGRWWRGRSSPGMWRRA